MSLISFIKHVFITEEQFLIGFLYVLYGLGAAAGQPSKCVIPNTNINPSSLREEGLMFVFGITRHIARARSEIR